MTVPEFLPSLAAGAHDADEGEACVMEYVALLAGEPWSDRPECTHPLLAHEARMANDLLSDADRPRLVPLVGRLFGTTEDSPDLRARLRIEQARQTMRLLEPGTRGRVDLAISRATAHLDGTGTGDASDALQWAMALPRISGGLDPDHAEFHRTASHIFAFVGMAGLDAAEAWATAAVVASHVVAATGVCRADCGDPFARGRRMVRDLDALLDVYDDVTGRIAAPVDPQQLQELADQLG